MMVSITKIYPKLWVAWHEITKTQYQKPRFIGCNLANTLWYTHCLTIRSQYSHLWTSGSNPVMWHSHSDGWFSGTLNKQTNKQASNQANMKPQINKHKGKCVSFTDVGVRMYVYIYVYKYTYETCTYIILYTHIHIHTLFYIFACDYETIWNKYSIRLLLCDWEIFYTTLKQPCFLVGESWKDQRSVRGSGELCSTPRVTLKHHDSFSDGWRALKRAGFAFRIRMMMRVCSTPAAARHQCIDDVWIPGHLLSIIDVFFWTCLQ
jgi:hypothetical protein